MKKWLLTICSVLFLIGCTDDKTVTPKTTEDATDQVVDSAEDTQDTTGNLDMEIIDPQEPTENTNTVEQKLSLEDYEEYQTLSVKIDLTLYQATLGTDNPGKRILLFTDADGRKLYKSIYIKHDHHLKIIELDGDGLLYNNQVQ